MYQTSFVVDDDESSFSTSVDRKKQRKQIMIIRLTMNSIQDILLFLIPTDEIVGLEWLE